MGFARFAGGEMRVHRDRIDALCFELVLLILHESDQRAHDDSQSWQRKRGKLVDERLAAAGGHHDKCIASIQEGFDWLPLPLPEILMAKALTQQSESFGLGYLIFHCQ